MEQSDKLCSKIVGFEIHHAFCPKNFF